jgi:hypothetical protein
MASTGSYNTIPVSDDESPGRTSTASHDTIPVGPDTTPVDDNQKAGDPHEEKGVVGKNPNPPLPRGREEVLQGDFTPFDDNQNAGDPRTTQESHVFLTCPTSADGTITNDQCRWAIQVLQRSRKSGGLFEHEGSNTVLHAFTMFERFSPDSAEMYLERLNEDLPYFIIPLKSRYPGEPVQFGTSPKFGRFGI